MFLLRAGCVKIQISDTLIGRLVMRFNWRG